MIEDQKGWRDRPRSKPAHSYTDDELTDEIARLEALKEEVQEELKALKMEVIARHVKPTM